MIAGLDAATLWITVLRSTASGRRCRDYAVCAETGTVLLAARAFPWDRTIRVNAGTAGDEVLRLRRRVSFPLTGRVDVLAAGGTPLGACYRNGRFADARGRLVGRFRDARGLRARTGESVLAGVADALLGGECSTLSSPTAYVCTVADRPGGTLALARLPWVQQEQREASRVLAAAGRLLPARLRTAMGGAFTPTGWRFERGAALLAAGSLLTSAAALFQVELSQW